MTTETITMKQFVESHAIRIVRESIPQRSDRPRNQTEDEQKWDKEAGHWKITLQIGPYDYQGKPARTHTCEYSCGSAHRMFRKKIGYIGMGDYGGEADRIRSVMGMGLGNLGGKRVDSRLMFNPSRLMKELLAKITEPMPPDAETVLDSLLSDADSWTNARDFADWCSDLGYDTDSIKAESVYRACGETAKALRFFLGDSAYETLRTSVERM